MVGCLYVLGQVDEELHKVVEIIGLQRAELAEAIGALERGLHEREGPLTGYLRQLSQLRRFQVKADLSAPYSLHTMS